MFTKHIKICLHKKAKAKIFFKNIPRKNKRYLPLQDHQSRMRGRQGVGRGSIISV